MAIESDWAKFFGNFGDSTNNIVTSVTLSSSAVTLSAFTPTTAITRIVPSTSGVGSTITITGITQPWTGFTGSLEFVVASTSITIATSSSGTGLTAINLATTLVGYKTLRLTHDGFRWNPDY